MAHSSAGVLTIRFAEISDFQACCSLDNLPNPDLLRQVLKLGRGIVAISGDDLSGYLRVEYIWSKMPFMSWLKVAPGHRRQGVATKLVAFFEHYLKARGHEFILSSTMPDNPVSYTWHRKMGYRECGFLAGINKGGIGEIFFRKDLA